MDESKSTKPPGQAVPMQGSPKPLRVAGELTDADQFQNRKSALPQLSTGSQRRRSESYAMHASAKNQAAGVAELTPPPVTALTPSPDAAPHRPQPDWRVGSVDTPASPPDLLSDRQELAPPSAPAASGPSAEDPRQATGHLVRQAKSGPTPAEHGPDHHEHPHVASHPGDDPAQAPVVDDQAEAAAMWAAQGQNRYGQSPPSPTLVATMGIDLDADFDPTPATPHQAQAIEPMYAAWNLRFRALAFDLALMTTAAGIVCFVVALIGGTWWQALGLGWLTGAISAGACMGWFEVQQAATPGKQHAKLQVVDPDYLPVAKPRAVWRNLLKTGMATLPPLLVLDLLVGLCTPSRRTLHDRCSGSAVILRGDADRTRHLRRRGWFIASWWARIVMPRSGARREQIWTSGPGFPSDDAPGGSVHNQADHQ